MSQFGESNPYASPAFAQYQPPDPRQQVKGKVMAPAIVLMVVGMLGLAASIFNFLFSFTTPVIDPNAPQFVQGMQAGATGPVVAVIQGGFCLVNLMIVLGGFQMLRFKTWGLALTAAILAMVNIGTFCCVLGLPVGIWTIIILVGSDVKAAFAASAGH